MKLVVTTLLVLVCHLSSASVSLSSYLNAQFVLNDATSLIVDLSNVSSWTSCACECLLDSTCLTASYVGINQTCSLFSTELQRELLQLVASSANARVLTFPNRTSTVDNWSYNWNRTGITVAGITGNAGVTAGQLNMPTAVALGPSNTLYISDFTNNRVQKWLPGASNGTTVAGRSTGSSGSDLSSLSGPSQITVDSNAGVYVADCWNHRVVYWGDASSSGIIVAGTGTSGSATNQLNGPMGIALDPSTCTLYISDTVNARVMRYLSGASSGTVVAGGNGQGLTDTQLNTPRGLYYDSTSNSLLIANTNAHNIVRWVLGASRWTVVAGSATGLSGDTSVLLNGPKDVKLDSRGNIYVADENNLRIQVFSPNHMNGTTIAGVTGISGSTSTLFNTPCALAIDKQRNLYVADIYNQRVQKFLRI